MNIKHENHAFILIDAQKGFLESAYWGQINNLQFEKNAKNLLKVYRELKIPIIHIQHLSTEKNQQHLDLKWINI